MVCGPASGRTNLLWLQGGDWQSSGRRAMRAAPESRIVLHLRTSTRDSGSMRSMCHRDAPLARTRGIAPE